MAPRRVTNETLAAMLAGIEKAGNDRHSENRERLEDIKEDVKRIEGEWRASNGRLRTAERALDRHQWAIGLIGVVALAILYALLGKYIHP